MIWHLNYAYVIFFYILALLQLSYANFLPLAILKLLDECAML